MTLCQVPLDALTFTGDVLCVYGSHPSIVAADCVVNTYADTKGSVVCTPCKARTSAVAGSAVCCPALQSCQGLVNATLPSMYNPATRQCDNVRNKPSGSLCASQNTSGCINETRCTGLAGLCPPAEVQSVTNVATAVFLATPSVVASRSSLTVRLAGVSVPAVCPAVPTSGYTFQVSWSRESVGVLGAFVNAPL